MSASNTQTHTILIVFSAPNIQLFTNAVCRCAVQCCSQDDDNAEASEHHQSRGQAPEAAAQSSGCLFLNMFSLVTLDQRIGAYKPPGAGGARWKYLNPMCWAYVSMWCLSFGEEDERRRAQEAMTLYASVSSGNADLV